VLALYPANSLFLQGYLNTKGASRAKTLRMIKDAGFTIKSTVDFDALLAKEEGLAEHQGSDNYFEMKELKDLRPHFQSQVK
jgi:biotin synthase